jgi:ATP-binding cassette subfamily F protein 3
MFICIAAEFTVPKKIDDISLAGLRGRQLTQVDKKKLEKAEARLKQKQEDREQKANSNEAMQFIDLKTDSTDYHALNAMIDPALAKGKSKDIKIEDFDISFGGKRILLNANLSLVKPMNITKDNFFVCN